MIKKDKKSLESFVSSLLIITFEAKLKLFSYDNH